MFLSNTSPAYTAGTTTYGVHRAPPIPATIGPRRLIQDLLWAPMRTIVIQTALKSGIFDALTCRPQTAEEIVQRINTDLHATQMILNELCALGLVHREEDLISLTPEARIFLTSNSLMCVGGMMEHLDALAAPWRALPEVLRTGEPVRREDQPDGGFRSFKELARGLFPMSYASSLVLAEELELPNRPDLRILDVAAGSAAWSLPFAQKYPGARVDALDSAPVLEVAREYARRLEVEDRYDFMSGNVREHYFGHRKYDLVLLGQICHSEGAEWSRKLIGKSAGALRTGGVIVIAEMVPDDNRSEYEFPLLFAINMLVNTAEGDTFTLAEYTDWLEAVGMYDVRLMESAELACDIVIARKE